MFLHKFIVKNKQIDYNLTKIINLRPQRRIDLTRILPVLLNGAVANAEKVC